MKNLVLFIALVVGYTMSYSQICTFNCPAPVTDSVTTTDSCSGHITVPLPTLGGSCINYWNDFTMTQNATARYPKGETTVTWYYVSGALDTNTCTMTVEVNDPQNPSLECPADILQSVDPGSCDAAVSVAALVSIDNCEIDTFYNGYNGLEDASDTYPLGINVVNFFAVDASGNGGFCNFDIVIYDGVGPELSLNNETIYLDNGGNASIFPNQLDNGSFDHCNNPVSFPIAPYLFGCSDLGANTVIVDATDAIGNHTISNTQVTVVDTIKPVSGCKTASVTLNLAGTATISAFDINNGTSDNCSVFLSASPNVLDCSHIGTATVYLVAEDPSGNKDSCASVVTVIDNTDPTLTCQNTSVFLDASGNANVVDNDIINTLTDNCTLGANSLDVSSFDCLDIFAPVPVTLTASDGSGNTSTCLVNVSVQDTIAPTVIGLSSNVYLDGSGNLTIPNSFPDAGSFDNCNSLLFNLEQTVFDTSDLGNNVLDFIVSDPQGNSDTLSIIINVVDSTSPVAICQDIPAYLNGSGSISILPAQVDNGSSDAQGIDLLVSPSSFSCATLGPNTVTLTAVDPSSNVSTCSATVTVIDSLGPNIVVQDISVYVESGGSVVVPSTDIDNGTSDNCGAYSISISPDSFTIADAGPNTVNVTSVDGNGNVSLGTVTITVLDSLAPTAICKDDTIYLNSSGVAVLSGSDIDGGSFDLTPITLSATPNSFVCSHIGVLSSTLTVTDASSNTATCTANVTILDNVAPLAIGQNQIVYLNNGGFYSLDPSVVDNGSTDNCTTNPNFSFSLSDSSFSSLDMGVNPINFIVTDESGNSSIFPITVTVVDTLGPQIVCGTDSIYLDGSGNGLVDANVLGSGTTDGDSFVLSSNPSNINCSHLGNTPVTLTATDPSGNSGVCGSTITVLDTTSPIAVGQTITLNLDTSGSVILNPSTLDGGSSDNCGPLSFAASQTSFGLPDMGSNTVLLTVTDGSGNISTVPVTILIMDTVPPEAVCKDVTLYLNQDGLGLLTPDMPDNGSSDPSGTILSLTDSLFYCSDIGIQSTTLIATDISGNSDSCTSVITVIDNLPPISNIQNGTLYLDALGNATLVSSDLDNGSVDNCGILSFLGSQITYGPIDLGPNNIEMYVTDLNGNVDTVPTVVTVLDTISPTAICQDITVYLGASGTVSIFPTDLDGGSTDLFPLSFNADQVLFDCNSIGSNSIGLTVTDLAGNTSICTSVVTVLDTILPTPIANDLTVVLDSFGNASINIMDIDNGSFGNCNPLVLDFSPLVYGVPDLGTTAYPFVVTDLSGLSDSVIVNITVLDTIAPLVICSNTTVYLNADGEAGIGTSDIDGGSFDSDMGLIFPSPAFFDCSSLGPQSVILSATDGSGNNSTCTSTVTVLDTSSPAIFAPPYSLNLDSNGLGQINGNLIGGSSTDNCGPLTFEVDIDSFDGGDLGPNNVILTVTDGSGNTSTSVVVVNVLDNTAPVAVCQDTSLNLPFDGTFVLDPSFIDAGSSDPNGFNLTISQDSLDCSNLGLTPIVLTIADFSGNTSSCTGFVTLEDQFMPNIIGQDITVYLDASGAVVVQPLEVDGGSTDNCGFLTHSISQSVYGVDDIGPNSEILTIEDLSGNLISTTVIVTVLDTISPIALCQNAILELDSNGELLIDPALIDAGSSDADTVLFSVTPSFFSCGNIGPGNSVVLTVSDPSGNSSTCSADIFIQDNIDPTLLVQDVTLPLNSNGDATLTISDFDLGSYDNCDSLNYTFGPSVFTTSDIGTHEIFVLVSDGVGNQSVDTITVEVVDVIDPVAFCIPSTLFLDSDGLATLTPSMVDGGSFDASGVTTDVSPTLYDCSTEGANLAILTVTDGVGNQSSCTALVNVNDSLPPVLSTSPFVLQLDSNGVAILQPSDLDNGTVDNCGNFTLSIDQQNFGLNDMGTNLVELTAIDQFGNQSSVFVTVVISDNNAPVALCQNATVYLDVSGQASISPSDIDGGSSDPDSLIFAISTSSYDCSDIGTNTVILSVSDPSNNQSSCNSIVTVLDTLSPALSTQNLFMTLDSNGQAVVNPLSVDNGSTDNCGPLVFDIDPAYYYSSDIGINTALFSATDPSGNISTVNVTITINDDTPPTASCINASVVLDPLGNVTINGNQLDGGSYDPSGVSFSVSSNSFDCGDVGPNPVVLTVTDGNGNTSSCISIVYIEDETPPSMMVNNGILYLDQNGLVPVNPSVLDGGIDDACGIGSIWVSPNIFDCNGIGTHLVWVYAADNNGNIDSSLTLVEVFDTLAPNPGCQIVSLSLDSLNPIATVDPLEIDNGSTDNCGISSYVLSQNTFNVSNVGINEVVLTLNDFSGNSSSCTTSVLVQVPPPIAECVGSVPDIYLNSNGLNFLLPSEIDNGSSAIGGISSLTLSPAVIGCSEVGVSTIILTVEDFYGRNSTCSAVVNVFDTIPPLAACQNVDLQLDLNGLASINNSDVDFGSEDACGLSSVSLSQYSFNGSFVGANSVVLTATDVNQNVSTCTSIVNVIDPYSPFAICQDASITLNADGTFDFDPAIINNGSYDNVGIVNITASPSSFACQDTGIQTVTLEVVDSYGNFSTCSAQLLVQNPSQPEAYCKDLIIQMDSTCNIPVLGSDLDFGSELGCTGGSLVATPSNVTCNDIGVLNGILTATDGSGNTSTCLSTITVFDIPGPKAYCQDITVGLSPSGQVVLSPLDIDNGSTDEDGIASMNLVPENFDCNDMGQNTVTLWVHSITGDSSACQALVTINDPVTPSAICHDIDLYLDINGEALLTGQDIDAGSFDNCGLYYLSNSISNFDSSHLGLNNVILFIEDNNGNIDSCTSVVTVLDTIAPLVNCNDLVVYVDANCEVSLNAGDFNNGSFDAGGILGFYVQPAVLTCDDLGTGTITFAVQDLSGNTGFCYPAVTVVDTISPVAISQNMTVGLDGNGNLILEGPILDSGSYDNDGISDYTFSIDTLDCSDIGTVSVEMTVSDPSGNTATSVSQVTVVDNLAPEALCTPFIASLGNNCEVDVSVSDVDGGTNDGCGLSSISVFPTHFTSADIGNNGVILTAVDNYGHTSTCAATVVVIDNTNPDAICQDLTVYLDSTGATQINSWDIDAGSSDECGISSVSLNHSYFTGSEVGQNLVELSVVDANGNESICYSVVTVFDSFPPVAACEDVTIQLDAFGEILLEGADVDDGSFDYGGIISYVVSPAEFFCSDVGPQNVTLTITDVGGNTASCSSIVTVEDSVAQAAVCADLTLTLNPNDTVSINPLQINNQSYDACGIINYEASQTIFTSDDIGTNVVTLTITDFYGNTASCISIVTVESYYTVVALCKDTSVVLDPSGIVVLQPEDLDGGSFDSVGISSVVISQTHFDCNDGGNNIITLTAFNFAGISASCTSNVYIMDTLLPVANCIDLSVTLDPMGYYEVLGNQLAGASTDLCGIDSFASIPSSFDCNDVGTNLVQITVFDINGNTSSCLSNVTVNDSLPPIANCTAFDFVIDGSGNGVLLPSDIDNMSSASCGDLTFDLSQEVFSCSDLGVQLVTLTVTDENFNTSSCVSSVNVIDNTPPFVACSNFTLILDPITGLADLLPQNINNGSSDECGIAGTSLSQSTFSGPDVGTNTVDLIVTDFGGNTNSCVALVEVVDNTAPVAICQDAIVSLDSTGYINLDGILLDNGSYDNGGIASWSANPYLFSCSELGLHSIQVTVTDFGGNSSICSGFVEIVDSIAPNANCNDMVVFLNGLGQASISEGNINNFTSDACGLQNLSLNQYLFDCNEVGPNTVTLTASDVNANTDSCTAIVTVVDSVPPTAICQVDLEVELLNTGFYTLTAQEINGGSYDQCFIDQIILNPSMFGPGDMGLQTVVMTVIDAGGNQSSCSTIVDVIPFLFDLDFNVTNEVCLNSNGGAIDLSVSGGAPPYSFFWSNGDTTQNISDLAPGNYFVTITDVNGFSSQGNTNVSTQAIVTPAPQIEPFAPVEVCYGEDVTLDGQMGYFSYLWNTGDTTQTITVDSSGFYSLTVTNGFGCVNESGDHQVVIQDPLEPIVINNNGVLNCTPSFISYQWYLNGNLVLGGQDQTLSPIQNGGNYTVEVEDDNGCIGTSSPLLGEEDDLEIENLSIFPNPATSKISVRGNIELQGEITISIISTLGVELIKNHENQPFGRVEADFDLSGWAQGYYFIKIETESGVSVHKFLIRK